MNIYIRFDGEVTPEKSHMLTELAELINENGDLPVDVEKKKAKQGMKPIDLVTALSIVGVALSAIGTLISILSFRKSQEPSISVSITRGDTTISIDNVKPNQIQQLTSQLEAEESPEIGILLSGGEKSKD